MCARSTRTVVMRARTTVGACNRNALANRFRTTDAMSALMLLARVALPPHPTPPAHRAASSNVARTLRVNHAGERRCFSSSL